MTSPRAGEAAPRTRCEGSCHCGALGIVLELTSTEARVQIRECPCSFCRKHGARMISDPRGSLVVGHPAGGPLHRYRFATQSVEFLSCGTCGVLVGALSDTAEGLRAVVNLRVLGDASGFTREPEAVRLDGESAEARRARHARTWTPARLLETGSPGPSQGAPTARGRR